MGLLDRLGDLWRRLWGRGGESATTGADGALRCQVCGTTAEAGAEECPLCRGSDLAPVTDQKRDGGPDTERAGPDRSRVGPDRTTRPDATDEAAERLRDVRRRDEREE